MSTLTITLPDSVRQRVVSMAEEDGVPVEEFVASILAQRVAVADADSYIRRRAASGSSERMLEILRSAPDVEPEECDQLSEPS
jgi:hypothetical protein